MKVAASRAVKEDPVIGLERFKAAHPEVTIKPPSLANGAYWIAEQDGERVVSDSYWLEWMLSKLAEKYS